MSRDLPLVYSCRGYSSAAQMANHVALALDRAGIAEMSCIAGLVCTAQSGRRILALDGCVLRCAAACLARAGVVADRHLVLSDYGVRKHRRADFDVDEARGLYARHVLPTAQALRGEAPTAPPDVPDAA